MGRIIKPQSGPQERFLSTSADIAIYGGAAGGGKTFALLMEPLRYVNTQDYRAVIFRRNYNQIAVSGGLWEESVSIYGGIKGARSAKSPKYHWSFSDKASLNFDYLGRDEDLQKWQGSQITFIGFDELTHFTEKQFFYMLSRNRSTCGVKPYVRATCNPDADSWVAKLIEWWIDPETGYPMKERSGKLRYMARINETLIWGDTKSEVISQGADPSKIKSVTFIASTLQDNKMLMLQDPSYLANLEALPLVERERLLHGNWKIKSAAGLFFKRTQLGNILGTLPKDIRMFVRAWDFAATSEDEDGDPAYTAGVLMGRRADGRFVVIDVINVRLAAGDVRKIVKQSAILDTSRYGNVHIRIPQDPGQAGKAQAQSYITMLAGYSVKALLVSGDKETRAEPVAAQWQAGNFDLMTGSWNEEYLSQMENFPKSKYKDMVDATSDAFFELVQLTEYDKLIYPAFSEADNVYTGRVESVDSETRRYIAVHFSPVSAMVFLEILDDGNVARVEREYYNKNARSEKDIADFSGFAGNPETVTAVIVDDDAVVIRNALRNAGYRLRSADEDVLSGISKVSTMFAVNKLLVSRDCPNLINEIHGYIWDEKSAEHGIEKPIRYNDAACEALRKVVATAVYNKRRLVDERD